MYSPDCLFFVFEVALCHSCLPYQAKQMCLDGMHPITLLLANGVLAVQRWIFGKRTQSQPPTRPIRVPWLALMFVKALNAVTTARLEGLLRKSQFALENNFSHLLLVLKSAGGDRISATTEFVTKMAVTTTPFDWVIETTTAAAKASMWTAGEQWEVIADFVRQTCLHDFDSFDRVVPLKSLALSTFVQMMLKEPWVSTSSCAFFPHSGRRWPSSPNLSRKETRMMEISSISDVSMCKTERSFPTRTSPSPGWLGIPSRTRFVLTWRLEICLLMGKKSEEFCDVLVQDWSFTEPEFCGLFALLLNVDLYCLFFPHIFSSVPFFICWGDLFALDFLQAQPISQKMMFCRCILKPVSIASSCHLFKRLTSCAAQVACFVSQQVPLLSGFTLSFAHELIHVFWLIQIQSYCRTSYQKMPLLGSQSRRGRWFFSSLFCCCWYWRWY